MRLVHPFPGKSPDLFLLRRARSHDNSQFVARYLELTHKIPTYIGCVKSAFEMVGNSRVGFVHSVGTKTGFISARNLWAVIAGSGARSATINRQGTLSSRELHCHVPAGVVHQIPFGRASEALILNGSAILQLNSPRDELPCANRLRSAGYRPP